MSTLSDSEIHSIISELKKSYVSHRQKDFMISAVYDLWKKDNFYIISYSCLKKKEYNEVCHAIFKNINNEYNFLSSYPDCFQNKSGKFTNIYINENLNIEFTIDKLINASFTALDLTAAGITVSELKKAGFTELELIIAGFKVSELQDGGFTKLKIKIDDNNALDLTDGMFTVSQLLDFGFTASELIVAGLTASEFQDGDFTALKLKEHHLVNASDLKEAGFTALELKVAGFNASDLKKAGFTALKLKKAGFKEQDLADIDQKHNE